MVLIADTQILKNKDREQIRNNYLNNLLPRVFRTEGDMVKFDPFKIEHSIIRETGLNQKAANNITEIVTRRIISSGMKFLSGPHIREIVCFNGL